jgi:patatin-like phospholipase/acyl hydrolase
MGNSNAPSGPKPVNFENDIKKIINSNKSQQQRQCQKLKLRSKILCLDGGGLRSFITINLLKFLEYYTEMKVFFI